jgi:hypothetical protein
VDAREDRRAVPDDVLRITKSESLPGLILAGEIDESSYPVLVQSLAALDPDRDVHVDLSGVAYCDLAGLRAIVCAGGPGNDGTRDDSTPDGRTRPGSGPHHSTPHHSTPDDGARDGSGPENSGPENSGPGGPVVLHAVPPRLRKILQILGWDAMPGVIFDERNLPGGLDPVGIRSGY